MTAANRLYDTGRVLSHIFCLDSKLILDEFALKSVICVAAGNNTVKLLHNNLHIGCVACVEQVVNQGRLFLSALLISALWGSRPSYTLMIVVDKYVHLQVFNTT